MEEMAMVAMKAMVNTAMELMPARRRCAEAKERK